MKEEKAIIIKGALTRYTQHTHFEIKCEFSKQIERNQQRKNDILIVVKKILEYIKFPFLVKNHI